jgi:GNAT superfamily N-acetyltransferase
MAVRLRPLREDEVPAFIETGKHEYAKQLVEHSGLSPELADRKTEQDWSQLLPDGVIGPDHFIFVVEDGESGARLGIVWFARRQADLGEVAFLYDVEIDEPMRGKGYGRAAMLAFEEEARRRGFERLSLNVFGGNEVARTLYRSLGYREWAVSMTKTLEDAGSAG